MKTNLQKPLLASLLVAFAAALFAPASAFADTSNYSVGKSNSTVSNPPPPPPPPPPVRRPTAVLAVRG